MTHLFKKLALALLASGLCVAQSMTPSEALDRYLAGSRDRHFGCADLAFAVQIEASLPKLKKQGRMSGLKLVSQTGQVVYAKPKRKRVGLFKGELWLAAKTAAPLRLWGDFVKSSSIFVRSFRFVQDYQDVGLCVHPLRLLLSVQTRLAGNAEMAVWLHSAGSPAAAPQAGTNGVDGLASSGLGQ